jgi:hypothetical protein
MAQRISRAKQRIRASGVAFVMPPGSVWTDRLRSVLHVLYLIFTEGYAASTGALVARTELSAEAIRLARALHASLPDDPEVAGLLALMLLNEARRPARTGPHGELVPLGEQDRTRWDHALVAEGRRPADQRPAARRDRRVPTPGRDRRGPRRGADGRGHPLAPDRRPLRTAGPHGAQPDRHPQPRGRGRDDRGPGRRPRDARRRRTATPRAQPT